MKIFKLYLETTLWNYLVDTSPEVAEKRIATETLMQAILKGHFEAYISALVVEEMERTPEPKRSHMLESLKKIQPVAIPISQQALTLAERYLKEEALPKQKLEDALHLAIATTDELDAIVSWNYRHIVNLRRKEMVYGVNLREGFTKPLETLTPLELIEDEAR